MTNAASTSASVSNYNRGPYLLAMFLTGWTFLVVTMGGTVKSHEAGLSIPEPFIFSFVQGWADGNRIYEFVHRALVGVLGVGVVMLVLWLHLVETRRAVKRFSLLLIVSILTQALIGYLTVRLFAHPPTSIPHAALGQSLLGMMAGLTTVLSQRWTSSAPGVAEKDSKSLRSLALHSLIAVFVQLLLGAALRHDDQAKVLVNGNEWHFYSHLGAHIVGAIAVAYFLAKLLVRVFRDHRGQPEILGPARAIMMLLGIQIILGLGAAMLKVTTVEQAHNPPPVRVWVATSHVVIGALIMALSALLVVRTHRYVVPLPADKKSSASSTASGASGNGMLAEGASA